MYEFFFKAAPIFIKFEIYTLKNISYIYEDGLAEDIA